MFLKILKKVLIAKMTKTVLMSAIPAVFAWAIFREGHKPASAENAPSETPGKAGEKTDNDDATNSRAFSLGSVALTIAAGVAAEALVKKMKGERS